MSARLFGARVVAIASLISVLALAGCSTTAAIDPATKAPGAPSAPASAPAVNPAAAPSSAAVPAVANVPSAARQITVSCDTFARQPKGSADVQLKAGDTLAVTLCANATTGFSWEPPVIAGKAVIVSGDPAGVGAAAAGQPLGAASATTFLFKADGAGAATVSLSYSRPWAGGEKNVWAYTVHVTVG